MAVDLEISPYGDLVFTGGRDLSVIRATDVLRQRIFLRLRMYRGSWRLNRNLGSDLYQLVAQQNTDESRARAQSMVITALREIRDEVSVNRVEVLADPQNSRSIIVRLDLSAVVRPAPAPAVNFQAEISLPLAPEPSETTVRNP